MTQSLAFAPTITVTEAAELIGVSRGAAYEAIRTGDFPVDVVRIGRRILVPTARLLAVLGIAGSVGTQEDRKESH